LIFSVSLGWPGGWWAHRRGEGGAAATGQRAKGWSLEKSVGSLGRRSARAGWLSGVPKVPHFLRQPTTEPLACRPLPPAARLRTIGLAKMHDETSSSWQRGCRRLMARDQMAPGERFQRRDKELSDLRRMQKATLTTPDISYNQSSDYGEALQPHVLIPNAQEAIQHEGP
jgi:hypothetical protein